MIQYNTGIWSEEEHDRFLEAMELFPQGPWKAITAHVRTRSIRQVQTHAQKYQEKLSRRMRGLRKQKTKLLRAEHRLSSKHRELVLIHRSQSIVSPKAVEDMLNMQAYPQQQDQHLFQHLQHTQPMMTQELPFKYCQPLSPCMSLETPSPVYQPYNQQQQLQEQHPYQHHVVNASSTPTSSSPSSSSSSAPQPSSDESLDFLLEKFMPPPTSSLMSSSGPSTIYNNVDLQADACPEQ